MTRRENWRLFSRPSGSLRVAGCGLRVAGCGLRVAGCGLRVAGCGLRVAGCGLRNEECNFKFKMSSIILTDYNYFEITGGR